MSNIRELIDELNECAEEQADRLNDECAGVMSEAAAVIAALAAENARLRAALEPFANLGVGSGPDDGLDAAPYRLTRGSIRQARAALANTHEGDAG